MVDYTGEGNDEAAAKFEIWRYNCSTVHRATFLTEIPDSPGSRELQTDTALYK